MSRNAARRRKAAAFRQRESVKNQRRNLRRAAERRAIITREQAVNRSVNYWKGQKSNVPFVQKPAVPSNDPRRGRNPVRRRVFGSVRTSRQPQLRRAIAH